MQILIAEDDRVSALKLRRSLEKMGHQVEVAEDGLQAWSMVNSVETSLLISDWMMPGLDGLELCRRIRGRTDSLYTYVILLTSRDSREDRLEGLQAGADDFLAKPLDMGELVARLNVARRILTMQGELRAHADQLAQMQRVLEAQNHALAELATTDALTGLKNRRHFFEAIVAGLALAGRDGLPVSVAMLDVDHFKSFNDTYGHPAGDEVLRRVASSLRSAVRAHDLVARYGGEEFIVLMPSTDAGGAMQVAERLRAAVAAGPWADRPITASIGVATATVPTTDAAALVDAADRALYRSKQAGRDRATHAEEIRTPAGVG